MNPYEVLGVPRDASLSDIKAAYRRLIRAAHPDREGGSDKAAAELNQAYAILSDSTRRKAYDETGQTDFGPQPISDDEIVEQVLMQAWSAAFDSGLKRAHERAIAFLEQQRARDEASLAGTGKQLHKLETAKGWYMHKGKGMDYAAGVLEQKRQQLLAKEATAKDRIRLLGVAIRRLKDEWADASPLERPDADITMASMATYAQFFKGR